MPKFAIKKKGETLDKLTIVTVLPESVPDDNLVAADGAGDGKDSGIKVSDVTNTIQKVEDIIDGTAIVGNSNKLDGQNASYYATQFALSSVKNKAETNASDITKLTQQVENIENNTYATLNSAGWYRIVELQHIPALWNCNVIIKCQGEAGSSEHYEIKILRNSLRFLKAFTNKGQLLQKIRITRSTTEQKSYLEVYYDGAHEMLGVQWSPFMVSVFNHVSLDNENAKTLTEYTLEEVAGYTIELLQDMPTSVDLLTTESDVVNSVTLTDALTTAKSYTDVKIADLINSAPETMDTLKEVADAIKEHQDVTDALNSAIGMKADKTWVEEKIGDVDLSGVMSIADYDSDKDGVVNQADKVTNTLTIKDGEQVYTYDGSQPVELQVIGSGGLSKKTFFVGTLAELQALTKEEQNAIEVFFNTEEDYAPEESYATVRELTNIINGTTLVTRAERDKNNNDIVETYATKEQLSAMDTMINDVVTTNLVGILDGSTPVGDAGKLGGQLPEYYANAQDLANLRAEVEESIQGEMYTKAQVDELVDAIDSNITKIIDGTTTVAKAGTADSATKATQDGNGKVISSTYLPLTGGTLTGDIIVSQTTSNEPMVRVTDGTHTIDLICGSGGTNRGLYDREINNWLCYNGADNKGVFNGNATSATKATQDGSGNTITSYYATLSTAQTISGAKTFSGVTKITNTTASSSTSTGALIVSGGIGCAGNIYGTKVYGAVYNDYAERRKAQSEIKPGYVVTEIGDDYVMRCASDRNSTAMIVSDTYGFLIGEDEGRFYSIPVGLSGRVLAYVSEYSKPLTIGDAVCSAKDGKVRKMNKLEKLLHPECIIGVVGGIPDYKEWGSEKIQVNGRIWINLK